MIVLRIIGRYQWFLIEFEGFGNFINTEIFTPLLALGKHQVRLVNIEFPGTEETALLWSESDGGKVQGSDRLGAQYSLHPGDFCAIQRVFVLDRG
jgi:hypothetical protein